jgi:hypothetical protein
MVGTGVPKATWDENMKVLRSNGVQLDPAPGVGDGGFFWDDRLYTHTADYEISISSSNMVGADAAKTRANAMALAQALIPKLKR